MTQNRFAILFAVLTVSSMTLFFNLYDPWKPLESNRIEDSGFETEACAAEWTGWDSGLTHRQPNEGFNHSYGIVLQTSPPGHGVLRKTITDIEYIPAFRVTVRAKAEHVERGPQKVHQPRTIFFYLDRNGKPMFHLSHGVFDIKSCNAGWKTYSNVFPVPGPVQDARLQIQNYGNHGTLFIDDISVVPVAYRSTTPLFNIGFTLLWIAALAVSLSALRPWKSFAGGCALLSAIAIMVGVLLPGQLLDTLILDSIHTTKETIRIIFPKKSQQAPQTVTADIPKKTPEPPAEPIQTHPVKKQTATIFSPTNSPVDNAHITGHLVFFMLLTFFSSIAWVKPSKPARRILETAGGLLLFAASTEVLQFVTLDRKAGLNDLGVDTAGILIILITWVLLTLPTRIRTGKKA